MQNSDPIVEEIRELRRQHAARFNYDVNAILRDTMSRQATSGRTYVRLSSQKVDSAPPDEIPKCT